MIIECSLRAFFLAQGGRFYQRVIFAGDAEMLWASPREVLNVVQAEECGCHKPRRRTSARKGFEAILA
jgi:hypothetical protein